MRQPQIASTETPDHAPGVRVMLVEDNVGFTYFIRNELKKYPNRFELLEFGELTPALAHLETGATDVLLLDLGLPDSTRIATFDRVRGVAPDMPVIILTVLDDDDVAMRAIRTGAADYLVKDHVQSVPDLLVRAIRYALERVRFQNELRRLSGRFLRLQDDERRRLARELHDTTGQILAALCMNLAVVQTEADALTPRVRNVLRQCTEQAERCSMELRTMSYVLHPPLLEELGLSGALRDYVDGFAARTHLRVDLEIPERLPRFPEPVETTLFRVAQESLANVLRHSGSTTASVALRHAPSAVTLEVRDRGSGIPDDKLDTAGEPVAGLGVGIAGMRERVRQLNGVLRILTGREGTTVRARLPCEGDA